MISRDTSLLTTMPANPDAPEGDHWVSIGEAAARVVEKLWREMVLREHPAPGRTLH